METIGIEKIIKNERGISAILIAVLMFALIFMVGIVLDLGYMYITKNQLQNAADAGALAGAGVLKGNDATTIGRAKTEARKFAECNKAGDCPLTGGVALNTSTNDLGTDNDITVGTWIGGTYTPTLTSPNAVQVRVRRTADSPLGQVNIFFSKLLGWSQMSAVGQAISGQAPITTSPVAFCINVCNLYSGSFNPASVGATNTFYFAPYPSELTDTGTYGIGWTALDVGGTSPSRVRPLICGTDINACNKLVTTTNGSSNTTMRQWRCTFKDPTYDSAHKYYYTSGPKTGQVQYWTTAVPVLEAAGCPPGAQSTPYRVVKYANVTISEVYASGGQKCDCTSDVSNIGGSMDNAIDVVHIECLACDGSAPGLPTKPVLRQ
jgi:Flp pilus assembly protein TadG